MKTFFEKIEIQTKEQFEFVKVDEELQEILRESKITEGLLLVFCPHTTSALICNEDNPTIHRDFIRVFGRLVPRELDYEHREEGQANARAHQLSMILGNSLVLPVREGNLVLGVWQSVFFVELLGSRKRELLVSILGE